MTRPAAALAALIPAALLLAALTVAGCTRAHFLPAEGYRGQAHAPTDSVALVSSFPTRPYEVLGQLSSTGDNTREITEVLRQKARQVGADAIVVEEARELSQSYASERKTEFSRKEILLRGVAIRYKRPPVAPAP